MSDATTRDELLGKQELASTALVAPGRLSPLRVSVADGLVPDNTLFSPGVDTPGHRLDHVCPRCCARAGLLQHPEPANIRAEVAPFALQVIDQAALETGRSSPKPGCFGFRLSLGRRRK